MNSHPAASVSRRSFLRTTGVLSVAAFAGLARRALAAPELKIIETKIISQQPEYYHGWPTIARRANGELWITYSGGREHHVCPFGQIHAMTSRDDGATWSWPRVLLDSATDDRDSGVVETAKGTLLVTTFTSLAYESYLKKQEIFGELTGKGWGTVKMSPEQLARWQACHNRLNEEERKAELGVWLVRSTDGGKTWSPQLPTVVGSPHGPIQLRDGRLLYAGKQLWTDDKKIGVCESTDDGQTWRWLAGIPARKDDNATKGYHELHVVEASDGTLVAQIRNHNKANAGWTLQTESKDGGKTWSEPHPICYGLPSHLLKLRDERLLMTYGHRRAPFGNQARVSADNGKSWSEAIIISGDGLGGDLGYPSTVELADGSLLTVWYEQMKMPSKAVLRQARWSLSQT
ncbi:MAG: exo-alpha-sialidase [Verrucomicrobia bacterium]|nr:exo-alpha-sialidase [Verrucomicrobiota bacterium]